MIRPAAAALAALLVAGCAGTPEPVRLAAVTVPAPAPVLPDECYTDPARFPRIPVKAGEAGVSGPVLLRTLDQGREAHRETARDKLVCRAALREISPETGRPGS